MHIAPADLNDPIKQQLLMEELIASLGGAGAVIGSQVRVSYRTRGGHGAATGVYVGSSHGKDGQYAVISKTPGIDRNGLKRNPLSLVPLDSVISVGPASIEHTPVTTTTPITVSIMAEGGLSLDAEQRLDQALRQAVMTMVAGSSAELQYVGMTVGDEEAVNQK